MIAKDKKKKESPQSINRAGHHDMWGTGGKKFKSLRPAWAQQQTSACKYYSLREKSHKM